MSIYTFKAQLSMVTLASEIIDAIRQETDLNTILQRAVTGLGKLAQVDRCAIWLYNKELDSFTRLPAEYRADNISESIAETAYPELPILVKTSKLEAFAFTDVLEEVRDLSDQDLLLIRQRSTVGLINIPIYFKDKLLGLLRLHSAKRREWDPDLLSTVKDIAAQLAIAIHTATLIENLRDREARISAIMDASLDAIVTIDQNGHILEWNRTAEAIFGYSHAEVIGQQMTDLIVPVRYREAHRQGMKRYLATGKGQVLGKRIELPAIRKDGSEFLSEISIVAIHQGDKVIFTSTLRDITDFKRYEQDLKESELRFRNLADTAPMFMAMADESGNAIYFNKPWLEWTGKKMDEMLGLGWLCTLHPEDAPKFERDFKKAFNDRIIIDEEYRFRRADGEFRWMKAVGAPRVTPDGTFIGYFGTYTDFHELKQTQIALQESEERFRSCFANAAIGMTITTLEGKFTNANPAFCKTVGYPEEELKQKDIISITHPADVPKSRELLRQLIAGDIPGFVIVKRYITRVGQTVWSQTSVSITRDSNGNPVSLIGLAEDITERKRAEEALRESQERYQLVIEGSNDGIWDWDHQTGKILWNKRCYEQLGIPYGTEITPEFFIDRIHPDDLERAKQKIKAHFEEGAPYDLELRLRHESGEYGHYLARGISVRDETGKVVRTAGVRTDVTNLKKTQQALSEALLRQEALLSNIPDQIWMKDKNLVYIADNETHARDFKTTREAIIGKTDYDFIPPDFARQCIESDRVVLETGESQLSEEFQENPDGTTTWYHVYKSPLRDEHGNITGLIGVAHNITDRKLAELAIKESEERFRTLADQAPVVVYMVEPDAAATISYFNKTWLDYTGQTLEDAIGTAWNGLIHPDDLESVFQEYLPAFEARQPYTLDARIKRHDGIFRWFTLRATPRYLPTGEFAGFIGIGFDDHDRRQAEEALRESEARLRAIMEATPECIKIVGKDGTLLYMNKSGLQMVEADDPDAVLGCACVFEVIAPEYRQQWIQNHNAICQGNSISWEFDIIGLQGTRRRMETHAVPLPNPDGTFAQLAVTRDVTERKKGEEALLNYTKRLAQSNKELDDFATIASHDLQAPLRKVITFADMLRNSAEGQLSEKTIDYIDRIQKATARMQELITDLLLLSRVTRKGDIFQRTDLNQIVAEVIEDLDVVVQETHAQITVSNLGSIEADASQMKQVFSNLIGNALKFIRQDVKPEIRITSQHKGGNCEITVSDNGIGFNEEYHERIFKVFERLHGNSSYPGTGIGLTIVRKIVERHQGSITALGKPNQGATFILSLPIKQNQAIVEAAQPVSSH